MEALYKTCYYKKVCRRVGKGQKRQRHSNNKGITITIQRNRSIPDKIMNSSIIQSTNPYKCKK